MVTWIETSSEENKLSIVPSNSYVEWNADGKYEKPNWIEFTSIPGKWDICVDFGLLRQSFFQTGQIWKTVRRTFCFCFFVCFFFKQKLTKVGFLIIIPEKLFWNITGNMILFWSVYPYEFLGEKGKIHRSPSLHRTKNICEIHNASSVEICNQKSNSGDALCKTEYLSCTVWFPWRQWYLWDCAAFGLLFQQFLPDKMFFGIQ